MLRAAIDAVNAGGLVRRALDDTRVSEALTRASSIDLLAAGKAAAPMLAAFLGTVRTPIRSSLGIGPPRAAGVQPLPPSTRWIDAGHPTPDDGSVAGARYALDLARQSQRDDLLVVLLSGGGSALMTLPATGLTLADKQQTARTLMEAGADIYELNTVRKHLSAIKGGQLAATCAGSVLTLAISDVVGDDLSVIASGPTVPDDSTFASALEVIGRRGGERRYPAPVVQRLRDGTAGTIADTPKTGDPRLSRATAHVIGPQRGAIEGARAAASSLGYHVSIVPEPITGEARTAAARFVERAVRDAASLPAPRCVIASGETTVTVTGRGRGGRNQEFAFAMAQAIAANGLQAVAASIGTDGIDGPTDAAGAMIDPDTFTRARAAGIAAPERYLTENNTYEFFDRIGDLIRTGPTGTNVGDLQVILIA